MKRIVCVLVVCLCLFMFPLVTQGGKEGGVDHTKKIKSYSGPETCMGCHTISKMGSNLAEDVFNSAHFQLRTLSDKIDMPGGGSHGMVDRACGLPGTAMMANNYAGIAVSDTGATREDGCGKCHIAYKPPYMYMSATDALQDIDCLRCHAAVYGKEWEDQEIIAKYGSNPDMQPRQVITKDGMETWSQDRSLKTAQTVGTLPKSEYCLRCHEHGLTRYKRATPYEAHTDVHAAAGVECYECHAMARHKIARGNYVTDGVGNDLPSEEVSCSVSGCHSAKPHNAANADALNRHTVNVTCEACHIPTMEGARNIFRRAWAPYTLDPMTGQWLSTAPTKDGEYPGFWDAYSEYHDPGRTSPEIRWFDGKGSMLAQPFGDYTLRKSNGGSSKLFALKPFVSGMLFDAGWLPGPSSDPTFDYFNGTWPLSMKQFYEMNWEKFLLLGFADSKYPSAADYWAARPDMAQVLNNFPMMLQFDRTVFMSEAGNVMGTPLPGPQDVSTYPGIVKAINVGMGRMGVDMGYCPPETPLEMCGQGFWSGQFFGMWVPVNMDMNSAFMGELGSFITMSHGIKGLAQLGEPCYSCHRTPAEFDTCAAVTKRVNFEALGYQDVDGNGCIDPKYGDTQNPLKPTVDTIDMRIIERKKAVTLEITVLVVDPLTNQGVSGVTVAGTLTGPDTGLPQSYTGETNRKGAVTFTYSNAALASGLYTLTVNTLTQNGQTAAPSGFSMSLMK